MQLFLKAPHPGNVKTRLARAIGSDQAALRYRELVTEQLKRLPAAVSVEVHFTPADARPEMRRWLGNGPKYFPQVDGDLGERLESAIEDAFARGLQTVVCIGGDCPGLGKAQIEASITALDTGADVVFGPTEDGGYYLIALRKPQPELFRNIPWSAPDTLDASLRKAQELGLKVERLEKLYDIDELKDLNRAIAEGLMQVE